MKMLLMLLLKQQLPLLHPSITEAMDVAMATAEPDHVPPSDFLGAEKLSEFCMDTVSYRGSQMPIGSNSSHQRGRHCLKNLHPEAAEASKEAKVAEKHQQH